VLGKDATIRIARAIAEKADDDYARTVAAGRTAVAILREASRKELRLNPQEARWLDRIEKGLDSLPDDGATLGEELAESYGAAYSRESYGL
jgi:hypothetical protein